MKVEIWFKPENGLDRLELEFDLVPVAGDLIEIGSSFHRVLERCFGPGLANSKGYGVALTVSAESEK